MDMDRRSYGRGRRGRNKAYGIEFPKGGTKECPVAGCPGRARTRTAMRVHFWRLHVRDFMIILEEGNLPHPRCPRCDMLVPALLSYRFLYSRSEERRVEKPIR